MGNDQYNARIPWLITNRMRSILIVELGYTAEEVDAMSASVAQVVINKRLERPTKGMPAAFKKDYQLSQKERFRSSLHKAVALLKKHLWLALAGSVVTAGGVALVWHRMAGDESCWWDGYEEEEVQPWWRFGISPAGPKS